MARSTRCTCRSSGSRNRTSAVATQGMPDLIRALQRGRLKGESRPYTSGGGASGGSSRRVRHCSRFSSCTVALQSLSSSTESSVMIMSPSRSPSVICPGPHLVIGMRPRPAVCVRSRLDVRMSAAKTASVSKGSSLLSARVVSRFEMIEKPFLSLARRMALPMALPS
ncbi:MAG: hypothetical protein BWX44_01498 [Spirochaetes bacterium ADurb.Bin001]|nr:MAG: hypothetical protein BWX44_01498 [Spirochaetes bacterium ADurb.Bin001]